MQIRRDSRVVVFDEARQDPQDLKSKCVMECRAAAYLARGWQGDAWFALLDSEQAMVLEPRFPKAHVRRVKSLKALGQLEVHSLTPLQEASLSRVFDAALMPGEGSSNVRCEVVQSEYVMQDLRCKMPLRARLLRVIFSFWLNHEQRTG